MTKNRDLPPMLKKRHPFIEVMAKRPVALLVMVIATMMIGLLVTVPLPGVTVDRIELSLLPKGIESRTLRVEVPLRSSDTTLSPQQIEKDITIPIEGELATIPGIESLRAESDRNSASFRIEFTSDTDLSDATAQVYDRVERAKRLISVDIGQPSYRRWSGTAMPIRWMSVQFDESVTNPFDRINKRILPALESVDGVADVNLRGDVSSYFRVALKKDKMANYDVGALIGKLQQENFTSPVGRLKSGDENMYLIVDSRLRSLEDLKNYPVTDALVLADVADVREAYSSSASVYTYAWDEEEKGYIGGRGVFLTISKNSDANTIETSSRVDAVIQSLKDDPTLKGFTYSTSFNQGQEITSQVLILLETVALGGLLAVMVLLLFLKRVRLALIIALSIPLSMTMALIVMYFTGEILSSFALMGFTIVAGMLLDNAIVVSENIYRRMSIDPDSKRAAVAGAGEVGMALALATSTTIIVFFSLGITGDERMLPMLKALGYPICFSLIFSIFVALAVIPYTMGVVFNNRGERFDPREAYHRFYRKVTKFPFAGPILAFPLRCFLGRPPEVEIRTGAGDWVDSHPQLMRSLYAFAILAGLGLGLWAAIWVFNSLGGEELWKPIADELFKEEEKSKGAARWMNWGKDKGPGPHPSLMAIVTFLGVAILPLFAISVLPRTRQRKASSPLISRLTELYGSLVSMLTRRALTAIVLSITLLGGSLWVGSSLMKKTQQNRGNDGRVRLRVSFPSNLDANSGDITADAPDVEYFLAVREKFFGVDRTGAFDPDKHTKAFEEYGIESGSITWSARGLQVRMRLDTSRSDEFKDLEKEIKRSLPQKADFKASGGFEMSEMNKVRINLRGAEFSKLVIVADELVKRLEAYPGLNDVNDGSELAGFNEAAMLIDRDRAKSFGVTPENIAEFIAFQLNGTQAPDYREGDIVRPIRILRDAPESREGKQRDPTYEDVKNIEVFGNGKKVSVGTVADEGLTSLGSSKPITRVDQQATFTISANPVGRSDEIKSAVKSMLDELDLPEGYTAEVEEGFSSRRRGRRRGPGGDTMAMFLGVFVAAGLILLVMGLLFESLTMPFVVLFACVPGAIAGAFWALILTDTTFDDLCNLGMLLLVGVSVNNGIVLVDLIERLRREGLERSSAIREACMQRMRPVLMTSVTTCIGLLPMALGSQRFFGSPYSPLGRTILGGILFSTLVTLIALPALYILFDSLSQYLRRLFNYFFGKEQSA